MLSRRALVGRIAGGVAGAAVAWSARQPSAQATVSPSLVGESHELAPATLPGGEPLPSATLGQPWHLISPLTSGAALTAGWTVDGIGGVADGAFVVSLRHASGRTQRVHVCRNAGLPSGLAHTENFDLVVMNGGEGDLPTDEALAQAVARLADHVANNEASDPEDVLVALLPHDERVRRYAGEDCAKLR